MDINVNSAVSAAVTQKTASVERIAESTENSSPEAAQKAGNVDRVDFSEDAQRSLDEENDKHADNKVEYYTSYIKPDTDDLSQYTANELSKLMMDGEITRSEYNEELARRNG